MKPESASPAVDPWKAFSGGAGERGLGRVLSLNDFEPLARARLPRPIFGYVSGAAETNAALDASRHAFEKWRFVTRVLCDVSARSQSIDLFGTTYSSPFGIAPMGLAALSAFDGDRVAARAAALAGIPYVLSGSSLTRLEDVAQAAPGSWFQAYLPGDEGRIGALLDRVEKAGFRTLVVTVDIPVAGNRENNIRAGFSTPLRPTLRLAWDGIVRPRWLCGTFLRTLLTTGMPHFENSFAERGAPILSPKVDRDFSNRAHFNWDHVRRIRARWKGAFVLKGILSPADAAEARRTGVDGVIVSNHGGRQLDYAAAPMQVLSSIVAEAGGMTIMMDGGVRRGTDVIKALALGARAVFIGRPFNYAASTYGEAGIAHAIRLLRGEVDRNLAMLGIDDIAKLDRKALIAADA
ncbi:MAG: alpha-hydroxy-acid oxidizing protein [Alphaproteobacteria bacterium]|nr:alpha-hydroxy-acid oxidizing protein [Alphaproteobacteria bacterium]